MLLTDLGFNCIDYIVSLGTIKLFIIDIFRYLVISMLVVCKYTINLYECPWSKSIERCKAKGVGAPFDLIIVGGMSQGHFDCGARLNYVFA